MCSIDPTEVRPLNGLWLNGVPEGVLAFERDPHLKLRLRKKPFRVNIPPGHSRQEESTLLGRGAAEPPEIGMDITAFSSDRHEGEARPDVGATPLPSRRQSEGGKESNQEPMVGQDQNAQTLDLCLAYPPTRPADEQFHTLLLNSGITPLRAKAQVYHRRILPALLQDHSRKWAAYHGDRLLEIGTSRAGLYRACLDRGLTPDEVLVLGIVPESSAEIDYPIPT